MCHRGGKLLTIPWCTYIHMYSACLQCFENCPDILKVDWGMYMYYSLTGSRYFGPDIGQFCLDFCQVKDCYCELCV